MLALLEDATVRESTHFGTMPPEGATLAERVRLIIGSVDQLKDRVRRFRVFYELLPETSRDAGLREHLMAYYRSWYDWAGEVLAQATADTSARRADALGQFASVVLDGIIVQMMVGAPGFDLEAALDHARRSLLLAAGGTAGEGS